MTPPAPARGSGLRTSSIAHPPTLGGRILARVAWAVASTVMVTLRWRFDDRSGLFGPGSRQQAIFAVWHNRQLLAPGVYRRYFKSEHASRRLAALASASKDGAIAARILELFDARAVRGSSSRRGAQAVTEMIDLARDGYDIAVTPDGPRGPRYRAQAGAVALAQHTGLPIIPLSLNLTWKKVLPSWDGFQIPLPFGHCEVVTGQPLTVPRDLDDEARGKFVSELERRLLDLTRD